jgi:hypothetical protein
MRWAVLFVLLMVPSSVAAQGPPPACAVPTFSPGVPLPVSPQPRALAAADLDGNGSMDLVAGHDTGRMSFLLNIGDGTFQPVSTTVPIGISVGRITPADINEDGHVDLIAKTSGNGGAEAEAVFVLIGDGAGGFSLGTTIPSQGVAAIAVGDFNGDMHLDLAVTSYIANQFSFHPGDGAGGFGPAAVIPTLIRPHAALSAADFNHDGRLDLAMTGTVNLTSRLEVRLGNGDGSFQTPSLFPFGFGPGKKMAAADFNGDGRLDLAIPSSELAAVSLLAGDGTGAFAPPVGFNVDNFPSEVVAGDFNHDGFMDLAVTARLVEDLPRPGSTVEISVIDVLPGNGSGGFGELVRLRIQGHHAAATAAADFNGDGTLDLAGADGDHPDGFVRIFRNMCGSVVDIAATLTVPKPIILERPSDYMISVENRGPDTAYALTVDIDVSRPYLQPWNLSPLSGCREIPSGPDNSRYSCVLGDVPSGQTVAITLRAKPDVLGTATVWAHVYSGGLDPTPDDHFVSDSSPVQKLGGEEVFLRAPSGGGALLDWIGGDAQAGYYIVRRVGSVTTVLPGEGTPLPATATSFTDPSPVPGSANCYVVVPIDGSGAFLGRSDMLCLHPATASASGAPSNLMLGPFTISGEIRVGWQPVAGATGYIVRTFASDGQTYWRGTHDTSVVTFVAAASSCYVVFAMNGETPLGNSDTVCAVPNVGNIPR